MQYKATGYLANRAAGSYASTSTVLIDQLRYETLEQFKNTCLTALGFEERFQLVLDNFHEWETELLSQAQRYVLWPRREIHEAMEERLMLDRRLVNLLTACRLYLDQTDHLVSQLFGNASSELKNVKKFKNDLYDKYFGYRFLEALRNYVQHCGLPVHIILYRQTLVETDNGSFVQHSVVPQLKFDSGDSIEGFKKAILAEIKPGEKLDLRSPVRRYISCFVLIHKELQRICSELFKNAVEGYTNALAEYSVIEGQAILYPKLQCCNDTGAIEREYELPKELLGVYGALHRRSLNVAEIDAKFVSNVI